METGCATSPQAHITKRHWGSVEWPWTTKPLHKGASIIKVEETPSLSQVEMTGLWIHRSQVRFRSQSPPATGLKPSVKIGWRWRIQKSCRVNLPALQRHCSETRLANERTTRSADHSDWCWASKSAQGALLKRIWSETNLEGGNKATRPLENQSEGGEREGANSRRFVKGIGAGIRRSVIWGIFSGSCDLWIWFLNVFCIWYLVFCFIAFVYPTKYFILD